MDGASGHLRLMGRDCSRPSPQASFSLCLIKLNYSACLRQTQLFIIIIPIFNLVRKMVKWEFAMVNLYVLHGVAHNPSHFLIQIQYILSCKAYVYCVPETKQIYRNIATVNLDR